ncbi:hypothetical protein NEFER03_1744 [Nematocida sp. LUAm3]|nr:hypothetical protein NEFER03_1744 [Nematocida sp. LUAm3]KAI5175734.1 hypothetical protein NEFER02_1621 [Nematocida sp. LUAm2]KAI5178640.1 hypothetical protein NEFER01_1776 [Nematocida sp. LUAm1]
MSLLNIMNRVKNIVTKVFTWGSGDAGQLGDDMNTPYTNKPLKLPFFDDKNIRFVVCGGMHTFAVSFKGEVYSWGCNDEGVLGRAGSEETPALINFGEKVDITFIVAGDSVSAAMDSNGYIWTWGTFRGPGGVIGHSIKNGKVTNIQKTPLKVPGTKFCELFAGTNHIMAIDTHRNLWSWGDSTGGKLGFSSSRKSIERGLAPSITLKEIAGAGAGAHHSMAFKVDRLINRTRKGKLGLKKKQVEVCFYDKEGNKYYVEAHNLHKDIPDQVLICHPDNDQVPQLRIKSLIYDKPEFDGVPTEVSVHAEEAKLLSTNDKKGKNLLTGVKEFVYETPEEKDERVNGPVRRRKAYLEKQKEEEERKLQDRREGKNPYLSKHWYPERTNPRSWNKKKPEELISFTGLNQFGQAPDSWKKGWSPWHKYEEGQGPTSFKKTMGGEHSTHVLDKEGALWSIGRNSSGQLGTGDYKNKEEFAKCQIEGEVTDFSITAAHVLAISKGELYSWGFGEDGQLGYDAEKECTPKKVEFPEEGCIISASAGGQHSAAVSAVEISPDTPHGESQGLCAIPNPENQFFSRPFPESDWKKFNEDAETHKEEIKKYGEFPRAKNFPRDVGEREDAIQKAYALYNIYEGKKKQNPEEYEWMNELEDDFLERDPEPFSFGLTCKPEYLTWLNRKINHYMGHGLLHEIIRIEDEIALRVWDNKRSGEEEFEDVFRDMGYMHLRKLLAYPEEEEYKNLSVNQKLELLRMKEHLFRESYNLLHMMPIDPLHVRLANEEKSKYISSYQPIPEFLSKRNQQELEQKKKLFPEYYNDPEILRCTLGVVPYVKPNLPNVCRISLDEGFIYLCTEPALNIGPLVPLPPHLSSELLAESIATKKTHTNNQSAPEQTSEPTEQTIQTEIQEVQEAQLDTQTAQLTEQTSNTPPPTSSKRQEKRKASEDTHEEATENISDNNPDDIEKSSKKTKTSIHPPAEELPKNQTTH